MTLYIKYNYYNIIKYLLQSQRTIWGGETISQRETRGDNFTNTHEYLYKMKASEIQA